MNYSVLQNGLCDSETSNDKEECLEQIRKYFSNQNFNMSFYDNLPDSCNIFISDLDCNELDENIASLILDKLFNIFGIDIQIPSKDQVCELSKKICIIYTHFRMEAELKYADQLELPEQELNNLFNKLSELLGYSISVDYYKKQVIAQRMGFVDIIPKE